MLNHVLGELHVQLEKGFAAAAAAADAAPLSPGIVVSPILAAVSGDFASAFVVDAFARGCLKSDMNVCLDEH
ncbi:hypothetical protein BGZ76_003865 [Entomortierella beljakovae]|nr:hypothetical protein BGZ76_003865 [Entomortierella beljakovae]